ncbi:glycoside hydrolase family 27 protein [Paracidobacterium acidisoli]|uniref:Alpha-galactosidase n=1 Tax=Paracidobacterium acidisoli TaxID=2303751 RepID=A0A372IKD1_9BACT|nr:glycoside hydrolase family 27 protein [Paracidobacterium acidisoli]MBT9332743.1 glycoside hydrolase family 27 protein [Paracidobacterium acidisoli]
MFKRKLAFYVIASICAATAPVLSAQTAAATPPMGWNSWNHFAGKVTDADVRAAADAIVSSGMRDAGYIYVNIDDTWQGQRDAQGVIHANSKFPDMKALADYVHAKGLKIGIYSSPGPKTCAGYEGSYGHEEQDAKTYAAWGMDYLKYDLCSFRKIMQQESNGDPQKAFDMEKAAYQKMNRAIEATGRPIVYSLCQYGWNKVWEWGTDVGGNLWRTTGDISDHYSRMEEIGFAQAGLSKYAAPGHWNDPDMLEVGNGGMTADEYRQHMSLWAILAAPLLAGNDLSKMTPETLSILLNKEVIAVDQDAMGKQGDRVSAVGPNEIWAKPLSGGAKAVALFNRAESPLPMTLHLSEVGFEENAKLRDLWAHKDVTASDGSYTVVVPRHGVVMLKITP